MKRIALVLSVILIACFLLVSCELTGTKPSKGTLHVVAIGDNFTGTDLQLTSCENDATALCQVFEFWGKMAGMETDIHNCNNTYLTGFNNKLRTVAGNAKDEDFTVIYVSTHGGNDIESPVPYSEYSSDNAFFVLEDIENNNIIVKVIAQNELLKVANNIRGKVLIIADFCYSGALVQQDNFTYNNSNYTGSSALRLFFDSTPATDSNKVFVLTASEYYKVSWPGNPLSVFTEYLLKAMGMSSFDAGNNKAIVTSNAPVLKNRKIILSDIYRYIYSGTSTVQVPQMSTGAQDLVLFNLK